MTLDSTSKYKPDPPPIDFALLRILETDIADNDPTIMLDLIDIFLKDSKEHFARIDPALQKEAYRQVEISVHSVKSSAATFGASGLSSYCERMEQLIRLRQIDEFQKVLPLALAEFRRVEDVLLIERQRWQERDTQ